MVCDQSLQLIWVMRPACIRPQPCSLEPEYILQAVTHRSQQSPRKPLLFLARYLGQLENSDLTVKCFTSYCQFHPPEKTSEDFSYS